MIRKAIALLLAMLAIAAPAFASDDDPVFALVLSGGGARGLTHIAAIQELDRRGIVPDLVVGTSMGALVGALYAAGYDGDAMEDVALHADLYDAVFSMPPMRTVGTIQSAFETEPGNVRKSLVSFGDEVMITSFMLYVRIVSFPLGWMLSAEAPLTPISARTRMPMYCLLIRFPFIFPSRRNGKKGE